MSKRDIIRAWKDEAYRNSLTKAELAQLPENPAGAVELSDGELEVIAGGGRTDTYFSFGCCPGVTTACW